MRYRCYLFAVLLIACGNKQKPGPVTTKSPAEVAVIVESQFQGLVTVYLEAGNGLTRLGEVHFSESKSFVVPWSRIGDGARTQLRGEVIGSSERVRTTDLRIRPGSLVRWTLTPRLSMSYYAIY